ncbi:MAG: methylmalonyl-CoA mutase, partial [Proteobacteria bacterium]
MNKPTQIELPGFERWQQDFREQIPDERELHNRSGIAVKPLYTPSDFDGDRYDDALGYPGQAPYTRGIYATMHRGRTWSQRQLIGLGLPEDYNARVRKILDAGANAISLIPCNSVYRGVDADTVDPEILGTCGTLIDTVDDMNTCMEGIPLGEISAAMNDPLPFTMLAQLLVVAERRGIDWTRITGTSNQSDYISHFVANHMFFRIALPGSKRVLVDAIEHARKHVPRWNPLSVVGQHMQQGGATPAEAMAFTLSTAIQYAEDCRERGLDLEDVLTRFTFFFDISISFFEEVAKFRAGRRIWARIVKGRFGVSNPRAQRFKFHAQTSGVDLTRQQPLNNIARVTAQAIAGIFGGLQSLHTDAFDEVLSTPTEEAARIAIASQNILRHEAHLTDVIDPLGGSYYVERLTDQMEERILDLIRWVDELGGMYRAVEQGEIQRVLGESAMAFQGRVDRAEETIVGVNAYVSEDETD